MIPDKDICSKFPSVLRDKLLNKEIEFPDAIEFNYEKILVFRAVEREPDDFHEVNSEDFKSYFELKKKPKRQVYDVENDSHYYGVSSFLDRRIVEQKMKFPNPRKKMAVGYVYQEGGPQETRPDSKHVCWWLYNNSEVHGFKLEGGLHDGK